MYGAVPMYVRIYCVYVCSGMYPVYLSMYLHTYSYNLSIYLTSF